MKKILINDQPFERSQMLGALPVKIKSLAQGKFSISRGRQTETGFAVRDKNALWIYLDGQTYKVSEPAASRRTSTDDDASGDSAQSELLSPMPAKIFKLLVTHDESVKKGQTLVILEAMKMEHALNAPFDGMVKLKNLKEGDRVELGQLILEVEKS